MGSPFCTGLWSTATSMRNMSLPTLKHAGMS